MRSQYFPGSTQMLQVNACIQEWESNVFHHQVAIIIGLQPKDLPYNAHNKL